MNQETRTDDAVLDQSHPVGRHVRQQRRTYLVRRGHAHQTIGRGFQGGKQCGGPSVSHRPVGIWIIVCQKKIRLISFNS